MATYSSNMRIWRGYEVDPMVYWLHGVCRTWNPKGSHAVLRLVNTYHEIIRGSPLLHTQFTKAEIVRQIMDLKEDYEKFCWFAGCDGVQFVEHNVMIGHSLDLVIAFGIADTKGDERFHIRCMKNFNKLRYLFGDGCLDVVDYGWIMNQVSGAEIAWLGEPFV